MKDERTLFYNVQHSPIGAFASFTLGCKGAKGGLGLEMPRPADENVFIGVETRGGGRFEALPFFTGADSEAARFDVERAKSGAESAQRFTAFADRAIRRELTPYSDTWVAGDLTFCVYSPVRSVPDPESDDADAIKQALVPAVLAELTVDNRRGTRERTAFFGYSGSNPYANMRRLSDVGDVYAGVGNGLRTALCAAPADVSECLGFSMLEILQPKAGLNENRNHGLGGTGALLFTVAPGECRTVRFAIAFHVVGPATAGMPSVYAYTRHFSTIESVGAYALDRFNAIVRASKATVAAWKTGSLSSDQRFMLAHAVHSYYGSTQLLETGGRPFWIVNEGEYRMMNTFDLMADQVFFELLMNPWTVRNELDWYSSRYSYSDRVRFPGARKTYPGGIAFTHDMGIGNVVSRPHFSSYEMFGIDGCFSHMTHEELVNWVCCGTLYAFRSGDTAWRRRNLKLFKDCLASMVNRDHPDPAQRNGVMALDSDRCMGGAEITTYDSLDRSLGQARNNLYMAVKSWAAYALLAELFAPKSPECLEARTQAERAAATIVAAANPTDGRLPAVLHEGFDSRIIPAVEGLVFPHFAGFPALVSEKGPYGELINALKRHLASVLEPGCCLFEDGGWKLSSTSNNSWLSKIYLCQYVARQILGMAWDASGRQADAAHVGWLLHPKSLYWAWSDQMISGEAVGSKYYPRGVTSILWTLEGKGKSRRRRGEARQP